MGSLFIILNNREKLKCSICQKLKLVSMELVTGDLNQIKVLTTLVLEWESIRKNSCTKTNSVHLLLQAVFVFQTDIER